MRVRVKWDFPIDLHHTKTAQNKRTARPDHGCPQDFIGPYTKLIILWRTGELRGNVGENPKRCPNLPTQPMLILWLSALVHQLSYVHWWTSYYLNKDIWYTINSWSTRAHMIAGRPWLILNCVYGCFSVK